MQYKSIRLCSTLSTGNKKKYFIVEIDSIFCKVVIFLSFYNELSSQWDIFDGLGGVVISREHIVFSI